MSSPVQTLANWSRSHIKTLCLPSRLERPVVMLAERLALAPNRAALLTIMAEGESWVASLVATKRDITGAEGEFMLKVLKGVADRRHGEVWPA
jgi:hypothetical protein